MRRIVIALASTVTGLVLLFSWPTSLNRSVATADEPAADDTTTTSETTEDSTSEDPTTTDSTTTDEASEPSAEAETTPASQTYTGAAASTRYGDVVVQITVTDGVLTDVAATEFPYRDHRDKEINDYAIPILDAAALEAASADIAMISGATITSEAYVQSLQDALDQAGL